MTELKSNLDELKNYLFLVLDNLDDINNDNFQDRMVRVNSLIRQIEEKRVYIKSNFSHESLNEKSDLLHMTVKQIKTKFDDIIEEKKKEQIKISTELNKLANKKKLINYQR
jgi:hypothetical protein